MFLSYVSLENLQSIKIIIMRIIIVAYWALCSPKEFQRHLACTEYRLEPQKAGALVIFK